MLDNLKVSHKDPQEVTKFIIAMGRIYNKKMPATRGKVHNYLGMDLDHSTNGHVKMSMIKYFNKVLEAFPEKLNTTATTPDLDYLFLILKKSKEKLLDKESTRHFHHSVA